MSQTNSTAKNILSRKLFEACYNYFLSVDAPQIRVGTIDPESGVSTEYNIAPHAIRNLTIDDVGVSFDTTVQKRPVHIAETWAQITTVYCPNFLSAWVPIINDPWGYGSIPVAGVDLEESKSEPKEVKPKSKLRIVE